MPLPPNKTKIVCTIGPASSSIETMVRLLRAGMNVARLNFSHGDFSEHGDVIRKLRQAERKAGRPLAIMADLPGPKMRIGDIDPEPLRLRRGDRFTLTSERVRGSATRVSVSFERLPRVVTPGDTLYLNDGIIQLNVIGVTGADVACEVVVGGELRSRKGLNLPGIDLGISAFTDHDRACLDFALEAGVDAVSQSFVEGAADVEAVRAAALSSGQQPFIIAKIERAGALEQIDGILDAADGIMVARGDLGVEIPIARMATVQKDLMRRANLRGKPVITATQMLESMTHNRRPTRAEATDVANAVLDGTDAVMLSGESAMGQFPAEATQMLASIAAETEPHRPRYRVRELLDGLDGDGLTERDLIALSVETVLEHTQPAAVVVPTLSGATARDIARFRLPVWVTAVSPHRPACQGLQFSYGVWVMHEPDYPEDWNAYTRRWVADHGVHGTLALLTEGPSEVHPNANHRMEIIRL